jgi:hypothetical protein
MKLNILDRVSKKYSNVKFHENPFSGSRVVPCGRTDMTTLVVAFRKFENVPKKNAVFEPERYLFQYQTITNTLAYFGNCVLKLLSTWNVVLHAFYIL